MEQPKNLVVFQAEGGQEIRLTPEIVRALLVNGDNAAVTGAEIAMFIRLCQYKGLNPFVRDAYLVKYGTSPATIITGKYVFTRRAAAHPDCAGWNSGVIVEDAGGDVQYRRMKLSSDVLIGGWAEVRRKSWAEPMRIEVSLEEYCRKKRDGQPMGNWLTMPETMIKKVAVVCALREAFPDQLGGLYDADEMPVTSSLPTEPIKVPEVSANIPETIKETFEDLPNTPNGDIHPVMQSVIRQIIPAADISKRVKAEAVEDPGSKFYTGELPGVVK